jgi:hypothetical protein
MLTLPDLEVSVVKIKKIQTISPIAFPYWRTNNLDLYFSNTKETDNE